MPSLVETVTVLSSTALRLFTYVFLRWVILRPGCNSIYILTRDLSDTWTRSSSFNLYGRCYLRHILYHYFKYNFTV